MIHALESLALAVVVVLGFRDGFRAGERRAPGNITDLTVVATTDSTATLTWTEEASGDGSVVAGGARKAGGGAGGPFRRRARGGARRRSDGGDSRGRAGRNGRDDSRGPATAAAAAAGGAGAGASVHLRRVLHSAPVGHVYRRVHGLDRRGGGRVGGLPHPAPAPQNQSAAVRPRGWGFSRGAVIPGSVVTW